MSVSEEAAAILLKADELGITWLAGSSPLEATGPCPHECRHIKTVEIASRARCILSTYSQCGLCGCRAWGRESELPPPRRWHQVQLDPALMPAT